MVEFTFTSIIDILAQSFFDGNIQLAGLCVMLGIFFVLAAVMAAFKAPIHYCIAPMLITAILFSYVGIIDTTIGFLLVIVVAVILALEARKITAGGE